MLNLFVLLAVAFLPFALIKPLATSLVAMPVLTAIAAGMLMALINSILRRCEVQAGFRYLMVLVFGLNPMLVFYAGNGEPVVLGMVMMAVALLSIISWYVTDETRGLVGAGLAVGTACLIDYSYGVWAIGLVMAVLIIGSGKSGGDDRIGSDEGLAPETDAASCCGRRSRGIVDLLGLRSRGRSRV